MPVNPSPPSRNAATATSLAAFSTIGRPASPFSARNASPRHGNLDESGTSKSRWPARARSSGASVVSQRSGYENAYWMGSRMSVTPSWAMIDPSTSSTIECTIDCGCTSTSIRSGPTSNSQRASITSSPLFINVAESMVIFGPIRQVGCRSAASGVTSCRSPAERSRNGPPDAVRIRRRTSDAAREWRHW